MGGGARRRSVAFVSGRPLLRSRRKPLYGGPRSRPDLQNLGRRRVERIHRLRWRTQRAQDSQGRARVRGRPPAWRARIRSANRRTDHDPRRGPPRRLQGSERSVIRQQRRPFLHRPGAERAPKAGRPRVPAAANRRTGSSLRCHSRAKWSGARPVRDGVVRVGNLVESDPGHPAQARLRRCRPGSNVHPAFRKPDRTGRDGCRRRR